MNIDRCGVCDGRGDTCDEVTRIIYQSDLKKNKKDMHSRNDNVFHHAGVIPKGDQILFHMISYTNEIYISCRIGKYRYNCHRTQKS